MGIRVAVGKYIYLIDGDDFIEDNILESWILFMEENALDICFSGYKRLSLAQIILFIPNLINLVELKMEKMSWN